MQQIKQHVGDSLVNFSLDSADLHPDESLAYAEDPVHFHFAIDDEITALQFAVGDENNVVA